MFFKVFRKKTMFPSFFFGKLDVDVDVGGKPRVHRGWNLLPHPFLTSRTVGCEVSEIDWSSARWDAVKEWLLRWFQLTWLKGLLRSFCDMIILRHVFGSAYSCFNCVKVSLALKKTCGGWSWSKQELDSTPGHTPRCFGTWIVIIYCCVLSSVIVLVKSLWTKWDLNVSWNIFEVASKPIPLNIASPLDSL